MKPLTLRALLLCCVGFVVLLCGGCAGKHVVADDATAKAMLKGTYRPPAAASKKVAEMMASQAIKSKAARDEEIKKIPADKLSEINAQRAQHGFPPLGADGGGGANTVPDKGSN
jgi:hypothetical protein